MLLRLTVFCLLITSAISASPKGHGCRRNKLCDGKCVNPLTDPKHCGNCRTHCLKGATCENGECIAPLPPPPSVCTGPSQCDSAEPGGDFTYCDDPPHFCICAGKDLCVQYINCNEPYTSNADCTADDGGYCVPGPGCCINGDRTEGPKCGYQSDKCNNLLSTRSIFASPGPFLRNIPA